MITELFDPYGSNSVAACAPNLIANLAAAASVTEVEVGSNGNAKVEWTSRLPLVLLVLKNSIEDNSSISVKATLDSGGSQTDLGAFEFAAFTERGASLSIYCPAVPPNGVGVPAFNVNLKMELRDEAGSSTTVSSNEISKWVEIYMVEGNYGRLLYGLHEEKAKIRRTAREVHAMRRLDLARRDALDRIGAEIGVVRAEEEIAYDPESKEIVSRPYMVGSVKVAEPDFDYLQRLKIYRPFLMPTRKYLEERLNGGDDLGLMSEVGYGSPIAIEETPNVFAVAIHLIDVDPSNRIANFQQYLKDAIIVFPANIPANNTRHAGRLLTQIGAQAMTDLRASIRKNFTINNDLGLSPMLADAVDRAGRVTQALGIDSAWKINRGYDPSAGSRYELGLGVDVGKPTKALINKIQAAISDATRVKTQDAIAESLIAELRSLPMPSADEDPIAQWFWNGVGLQTAHQIAGGDVYLSHLPTFGLAIAGPDSVAVGATTILEGTYHAPGDPGTNALLVEILSAAQQEWTTGGANSTWTALSPAAALAVIANMVQLPAGHPVYQASISAGAAMMANQAETVPQLQAINPSLYAVLKLPADLSAAILAGNDLGERSFTQLVEIFRRLGLSSMLTLVNSANEVHLVVSVISLPEVGINLGERAATGLRWYTIPIGGTGPSRATISPFGGKPSVTGKNPGLVAVVCLGYARRSFCDPYEYRPQPAEGNLLTLRQYEYLMNFLEHTFPIGMEVNTFELRKFFVDLDGDGKAEPLSTAVSKTYRKYYNPRMRGAYRDEERSNG